MAVCATGAGAGAGAGADAGAGAGADAGAAVSAAPPSRRGRTAVRNQPGSIASNSAVVGSVEEAWLGSPAGDSGSAPNSVPGAAAGLLGLGLREEDCRVETRSLLRRHCLTALQRTSSAR
tara:strand:+ start:1278 stop:1637 length:360 start_codon:yes stop_codon:yes gene_type:complete